MPVLLDPTAELSRCFSHWLPFPARTRYADETRNGIIAAAIGNPRYKEPAMHVLLLAFMTLTVDSDVPDHPSVLDRMPLAGEQRIGEPAASDVLMPFVEHTVPMAGPADASPALSFPRFRPWLHAHMPRQSVLPRYPASRQYYRNRPYDPRLMLDYPWHAPRVSQPAYPAFLPDAPGTAF